LALASVKMVSLPIFILGMAKVSSLSMGRHRPLIASCSQFSCVREVYGTTSFDPDAWSPAVAHDPADTRTKLLEIAGDKYSYRKLDDHTDLIRRGLT
jgi:hypothetical protein